MGIGEKEEMESTQEWLMRLNEAEPSEELMYYPSELAKVGVAPVDVVDRLDWLRENGRGIIEEAPKNSIEKELEISDSIEMTELGASREPALSFLNCDIEKWFSLVEDEISSLFGFEPELPEFNALVASTRPKRRSRGKRARSFSTKPPPLREFELASDSVGEH